MATEEERIKQRDRMREWRAKRRKLGLPTSKPLTERQKARVAERVAGYRAKAHAQGEKLASETWWSRNRDRHRENVARWKAENLERARELDRQHQERRRSTPWGVINNNMWPLMHGGVRRRSSRWGKYNLALGYVWLDLREHLETMFAPGMTWENWGDVWEVDHIEPLSSFRYASLDDPLFKQAWALTNLRPLCKIANATKGNKRE